jgi:Ion transport protein
VQSRLSPCLRQSRLCLRPADRLDSVVSCQTANESTLSLYRVRGQPTDSNQSQLDKYVAEYDSERRLEEEDEEGKDYHLEQVQMISEYFGRIDQTAWTLLQIMTWDNRTSIANQVMEVYSWSWLLLTSFIIVTIFFFGSLIIAVMNEAISAVQHERVWKSLDLDSRSTDSTHKINKDKGVNKTHVRLSTTEQWQFRMESKIQELTTTVDQMVRLQTNMQHTVQVLGQLQEHDLLDPKVGCFSFTSSPTKSPTRTPHIVLDNETTSTNSSLGPKFR